MAMPMQFVLVLDPQTRGARTKMKKKVTRVQS